VFNLLCLYYEWRRSCWFELAALCVSEKQPLPTWQDICFRRRHQPQQAFSSEERGGGGGGGGGGKEGDQNGADGEDAKIMYGCFLVHAYLEKHCGDLALQVLQKTLQPILPASLILHTQVGSVFMFR
jgi:hypothetical protein